jgi:hypothetical protein
MLRRDFLAAIASFAAAGAAVKAASPNWSCCDKVEPAGVATELTKLLDERSIFERTLVDCLRDGSMRLLGVTSGRRGDYRAVYLPAAHGAVAEQPRHETLMGMYDRGLIVVDEVIVFNGYSGVEVVFSICTR